METRMLRFVVLVLVAMLFAAGCTKVNKVKPINDVKDGKMGLVYVLPKTQLVVEVPITVKIKNGQLQYANVYYDKKLGKIQKRVNCENVFSGTYYNISYTIEAGDPTVTTVAVPDTKNIYSMDIDSSFLKDAKKNLTFNEQGMLVSGSFSSKDKTLEFAVQLIGTLAKLATVVGLAEEGCGQSAEDRAVPPLRIGDITDAVTEPEKFACYMMRKDRLEELAGQKAAYAAANVKKGELLLGANSGGVDRSVDVYKARMADLSSWMKELKSSLTLDSSVTLTFRKVIDPEVLLHGPVDLFEINSGKIYAPVVTDFVEENAARYVKKCDQLGSGALKLSLAKSENNVTDSVSRAAGTLSGEKGLYYRMPAQAEVKFIKGDYSTPPQKVAIAQWGALLALPTTMHSTDSAISFEFFADTGAIKTIGTENKAIDMEQVGKLGEAGVSLVKAIYAGNDEITRLTQEKEKLTLQKDIRDLRNALQTGQ